MQLSLLFLPLLGGYLFFTCFRGTGFRATHYPAERLLFPCATFGLIALFFGRLIEVYSGNFDTCLEMMVIDDPAIQQVGESPKKIHPCNGPQREFTITTSVREQDHWLQLMLGNLIPIMLAILSAAAALSSVEWLLRAKLNTTDPDSRSNGLPAAINLAAIGTKFRSAVSGSSRPSLKIPWRRKVDLAANALVLVVGSGMMLFFIVRMTGGMPDVWSAWKLWAWCLGTIGGIAWALSHASGWPFLSLCARISTVAILICFGLAAIAAKAASLKQRWIVFLGNDLSALADMTVGTITAVLACGVGLIAALLANLIIAPRAAAVLVHRAKKTNHLERIAFDAQIEQQPIQIDLEDGKVYVGFVIDSPTHADLATAHLAILPLLSGFRDPANRQLEITFDYGEPYQSIQVQYPDRAAREAHYSVFVKVIPLCKITAACRFHLQHYYKSQLKRAQAMGVSSAPLSEPPSPPLSPPPSRAATSPAPPAADRPPRSQRKSRREK